MISLDVLSADLARYGYPALFLACVVEGPIATVIGAFAASLGYLDVKVVYAVAVCGDLAGDLGYYCIGRFAGKSRWLSRSFDRHRTLVQKLEGRFRESPGKAILFGKWTHAAGFAVLLAAGALRMPIASFLGFNLLGTIPKVALFTALGYFAGAAYHTLDRYLSLASLVALVAIIAWLTWHLRKRSGTADANRSFH